MGPPTLCAPIWGRDRWGLFPQISRAQKIAAKRGKVVMTLAGAKIPILGSREENRLMRPGSPWSDVRLGKLGEPGNRGFHGLRKYKGVRHPKRLAAR